MSYTPESESSPKKVSRGTQRTRTLEPFWRGVVVALVILALFTAINKVFLLRLLGSLEFENATVYVFLTLILSIVFIVFPPTRRMAGSSVPWYDVTLFIATVVICGYLAVNAWDITKYGWDYQPPLHMFIGSVLLSLIALEAVRRVAGPIVLTVFGVFAIYPAVAESMPGLLYGFQLSIENTLAFHALGNSSLLGITARIFGSLVFGYVTFGAVLMATGGTKFIIDLAFCLVGAQRGGPAKVAVIASSLFGTMSGSVIANVATTGSVTIPLMKKSGYPPHLAGAIECTSSMGGSITPPIMGSVAFIMAAWLGMPYFKIAVAAAIPAILYYFALFLQVDAYAVTHKLKGLSKSELPNLKQTLKKGWPYFLTFVVLVLFMYLRRESQAPYIASVVLIVTAMINKNTRLYLKDFLGLFVNLGRLLPMIFTLLAAMGFVVGSFAVTGLAPVFASELSMLAGGVTILLLVFGAIGSMFLGMGMPISAAYIFLAIVLAPGLIANGIDPVAAHLFVIYWGTTAYMTPPVASGAYTAAALAEASFFRTGFQAMRLGIVMYLIPFFFVFAPVLVLQAPIAGLAVPLLTAVLGIFIMAAGLGGYLLGVGRLNWLQRVPFVISGLLIAMPGWTTDIVGIGLATIVALTALVMRFKIHH